MQSHYPRAPGDVSHVWVLDWWSDKTKNIQFAIIENDENQEIFIFVKLESAILWHFVFNDEFWVNCKF